jgi:F-type H+-transporting ATPase subunit gamma
MASLKEIRTRISSVKSTKQVTSAMKMVSAAKLRKAQDAITQMRPYAEKLYGILTNLASSLDANENAYTAKRKVSKVLLVVISSNRGLCGAFNANVIKKATEALTGEYAAYAEKGMVDFVVVGKKAADILKAKGIVPVSTHHELFDDLTFDNVSRFAASVMDLYTSGAYDKIDLIYNQFKNAASQNLMRESFLPVEVVSGGQEFNADYIFEPSKAAIVQDLIPLSLKTQVFKAMLDSNAAEHGARMTSMHQATDNATELIKELQLHYNKARQTSITNEILEIVAGAEALKS